MVEPLLSLETDMKIFEEKHKLSSKEFYEKFQKGEFGDKEDYLLWAGLYEIWLANKKHSDRVG